MALFAVLVVALIFVIFGVQIGRFDQFPEEFDYKEMRVAFWDAQSINSLNLLIGAFCVQNTCLPIYGELKNRSPLKMASNVLVAMVVSFAVYETIGMFGYRLIGGNVKPDCLLSLNTVFQEAYPWTAIQIKVAKLLMAFMITLAVPFAIWPSRSALCSVISRAAAGCTGPARSSEEASDTMFRGVGFGLVFVITVFANLVPDITVPLGLVNSVAGGSMIFIMPGLFYLGSIDRVERFSIKHWTAYAYIVLGIAFASISFTLEIRSFISRFG